MTKTTKSTGHEAYKKARWFKKNPRDTDNSVELAKMMAHHRAMLELEMAKAKAYVYFQKYQRAQ